MNVFAFQASRSNSYFFCISCFKTLKHYYNFANQCRKSNNILNDYISELTSTNENLGLFNVTINLTDIDPKNEIEGTVCMKSDLDISESDLKLEDIVYSESSEVSSELNESINQPNEFGMEFSKVNSEPKDAHEFLYSENRFMFDTLNVKEEVVVIDDDGPDTNENNYSYQNESYEDNSEVYTYDLNRLQAEPESFLSAGLYEFQIIVLIHSLVLQ